MPLVPMEKAEANKFTPEEQAEMDAADQGGAATKPAEIEPEPEPAPRPEAPQQQAQPEARGTKPPPGFVPQSALHETREELKALRAEAAAQKQRMEQTFQQLVQRGQQPQPQAQQPPPQQIPDFNTDPIGHMQAKAAMLEHELNTLKNVTHQSRAEQEAYAQTQQHMATYQRATNDFAAKTPDYAEAANFLRQTREKALSHFMTPKEVRDRVEFEEGLLPGKAMLEGKNPAELFYAMAKDWGYKQPVVAPPENKLERLAKGAKAAASLSQTTGASAVNDDSIGLEGLSELYASTDPSDHARADELWEKMARSGRLG